MRTLLSSSKRRVALVAAAGAMVAALLGGPALAHDRDYDYRNGGYTGGYVRHDEGYPNGYRQNSWRHHHRHHHYVARDYYGRPVYGYWR